MTALRNSFSTVHEQTAISLKLVDKKYGIRVAEIVDRSLIGSAVFVLAAKADMQEESVRNHLPAQVRIGPVEAYQATGKCGYAGNRNETYPGSTQANSISCGL